MAQIGNILVEFARWLQTTDAQGIQGQCPLGEGFDPEQLVERFLNVIEHSEWMPTTGAEFEEAHPEPEPEGVDIDAIIDYCEGLALNEAAATPVRLKAAEVVIRWADYTTYNALLEADMEAPKSNPPFYTQPRF